MKWTDVDFPVSGRYRIRSEADDILRVKVDGAFIAEARTSEGVREIGTASQGKRTIEMELFNKVIPVDHLPQIQLFLTQLLILMQKLQFLQKNLGGKIPLEFLP